MAYPTNLLPVARKLEGFAKERTITPCRIDRQVDDWGQSTTTKETRYMRYITTLSIALSIVSTFSHSTPSTAAPTFKFRALDDGILVVSELPESAEEMCLLFNQPCPKVKTPVEYNFQFPFSGGGKAKVVAFSKPEMSALVQNVVPLRGQGHIMKAIPFKPGTFDSAGHLHWRPVRSGAKALSTQMLACRYRNKNGQRQIEGFLNGPKGNKSFLVPKGDFTVMFRVDSSTPIRKGSKPGYAKATFRPASGRDQRLIMLERCKYVGFNP